jgi:hypothetical protein
MNCNRVLLALILLFLKVVELSGQGCSDAGFCTINNISPSNTDSSTVKLNQVKAGVSYGAADYSISVLSPFVEYSRKIGDRFSIDAKVTSISQSGNDISVFGISDLFLSANVFVSKKTSATLAGKLPFSDAGKTLDGLPLPMDYQSSLGTFDLIFGINSRIGKVQIAGAFQLPLSQNKNKFLSEMYSTDSELSKFQSTNEFKRSGDALVRISLPFRLNNKMNLTLGLLPIYHLANDKFTDSSNTEVEIIGSSGLTLNFNIHFDINVGESKNLQFILAAPLIVRDARPDGLTRSFLVAVEYRIGFQ